VKFIRRRLSLVVLLADVDVSLLLAMNFVTAAIFVYIHYRVICKRVHACIPNTFIKSESRFV